MWQFAARQCTGNDGFVSAKAVIGPSSGKENGGSLFAASILPMDTMTTRLATAAKV